MVTSSAFFSSFFFPSLPDRKQGEGGRRWKRGESKRRPFGFNLFHFILFLAFSCVTILGVCFSQNAFSPCWFKVGRAGRTLEERNLPLTSAQCLLLLSVFYLFCVWTSSPPPSPPPSPTPSPPHPSAIQGAWGGEGEGEGVKYLQIRTFLNCFPIDPSFLCLVSTLLLETETWEYMIIHNQFLLDWILAFVHQVFNN